MIAAGLVFVMSVALWLVLEFRRGKRWLRIACVLLGFASLFVFTFIAAAGYFSYVTSAHVAVLQEVSELGKSSPEAAVKLLDRLLPDIATHKDSAGGMQAVLINAHAVAAGPEKQTPPPTPVKTDQSAGA